MELYHIEPQEFEIIKRTQVDEHSLKYDVKTTHLMTACPNCKSVNIKHNGIRTRRARDLSEHGMMVGLVIHIQRYLCKTCGTSWTDSFLSVPENAKMTLRMKNYIQEQSVVRPFQSIADELSVSVQTVKRVFEDYIKGKDQERIIVAPTVLGLDENYLNGKYRGMYVDIENGRLIDMTENRKLSTVKKWLSKLPEKERIKCVTMDMWGPYKEAVIQELPGKPIVIDKFHVIKNLNDTLDRIRKSFRNSLSSSERIHFKNNRWLLLRNYTDLDYTSQNLLQDILKEFPQIGFPYRLKESFRKIYDSGCREDAEHRYALWKEEAEKYTGYDTFISMIENWKTEIFNYFDYPYTNATTESMNALAKEIAARGRGYSYEVLRYKVLYGTKAAKPPKYLYNNDEIAIDDNAYQFVTPITNGINPTTTRLLAYSNLVTGAGTDIKELINELRNRVSIQNMFSQSKRPE